MFVFRVLAIAASVLFGAVSAVPLVADIASVDSVTAALSPLLNRATPKAHAAIAAFPGVSQGSIFACTDANFRGQCANFGFNNGVCLNFNFEFQDSISSVGPDGGVSCLFFIDSNCGGRSFSSTFPGFQLVPSGFNDAISSFRCFLT